ncbi:MAG: ATP-binding protein, partial [Candidatus Binatota bacterium]
WDLRIDQLLFKESLGAVGTFAPGRMAPSTALNFLMLGLALLLLDTPRTFRAVEFFVLASGLIGLLNLMGYAYGVRSFYGLASYTEMAVHTAVAFIILSVGIIFARAERGLMTVVTSDSAGGVMARRLLPAMIGVPFLLGWFGLMGQRAGLYSPEFGLTLFVLSNVIVLAAMIWWSAEWVFQMDIERNRAVQGLRRAHEELEIRVKERTSELARANSDLRQRKEIQELLKELSQDITSLDIDSLLKKLTEKVRELLKVDVADVRVLEGQQWYVRGLSGMEPGTAPSLRPGTSRLRSGWILKNRRPLVLPDITQSEEVATGGTIAAQGIRGYLGVPIFSRNGEVIGILRALTYQTREFRQEEVDLLQQLANGTAIALENARLLEEIREQATALERANKIKSEFLSVMSHELRTPLNAIVGYTGMVQDGVFGETNAEQRKALEKVVNRSKDLLSMISDILEVSRMEAEAVRMESRDVALGSFLDELRLAYDIPLDQGLVMVWDYPSDLPIMRTDSGKLRHILQNLINNAIKFTVRGNVTVSARYLPIIKSVEFSVADTGIGISKEAMPYIFEAFRQGDSSETRSFSGVGVGLHIVKKFAELLQGKVEVESEPGKGSIFKLTFPFMPA